MSARASKGGPRARRSTQAARGVESRARLLEAATELVAERGVRGAAIGELCERAGVARTAIYWHFGSKEGLIAEAIEAAGGEFIERIRKQVYLEGDPFERLNRLIDGWREILTDAPELIRIPMHVQLEHGADPDGALGRAVAHVHERAEAALVEGLEDTLGAEIEAPERIAWTIVALLQGAAVREVSSASDDLDARFEELRRTIVLVIWSRLSPDARAEIERILRERKLWREPA